MLDNYTLSTYNLSFEDTLETLAKIATVLGCKLDDLVDYSLDEE